MYLYVFGDSQPHLSTVADDNKGRSLMGQHNVSRTDHLNGICTVRLCIFPLTTTCRRL
jgi:hypothetical protein